jgi:hypothetical protein
MRQGKHLSTARSLWGACLSANFPGIPVVVSSTEQALVYKTLERL